MFRKSVCISLPRQLEKVEAFLKIFTDCEETIMDTYSTGLANGFKNKDRPATFALSVSFLGV